ncbi:heme peroxidase [Mycobacterium barrassiae]|uniref:heme peroxidase n=1 Tax=Mycobacterium barrassiae TaxID=319709 RepID=UPI002265B0A8|nr:heme peroxidase [Mycobacterium barrassiae]MCV7302413.1 heme peroxidase [Mycobacterium barrassiae]
MAEEYNHDELARLIAAIEEELGDPALWATPDGYPASLALCVIDSIFSIGVNYSGVVNVIGRYRSHRIAQSGNADADGLLELMGTFEYLGGPERWADEIGNKQRTSTKSGILKAEAVLQEAHVLAAQGVWTVRDLQEAQLVGRLPEIKAGWRSVRGQKSGISWNYFLMLARVLPEGGDVGEKARLEARPRPSGDDAVAGVKPDRMIKRYVAGAIGADVGRLTERKAAALVKAAAEAKVLEVVALDHAIWRFESGRSSLADSDE